MEDEAIIELLDLVDDYISKKDRLTAALRQGYFDLAKIRYATGHLEVLKAHDANITPTRVISSDFANRFDIIEGAGPLTGPKEAENPLVTNDCHTPPLTEALRPEQRQAQQRDFEGLLQELADKYIYTEESLQPNDAYSDCSLDLPMQARKQYVSPKLRVLQTSFRDVLDAVVIAATARAALLSHLQEQS